MLTYSKLSRSWRSLLLCLGSLLRFENGTVSFINSTFKRYIEKSLLPQSSRKFDRPGVNIELTCACLMFLDICISRRERLGVPDTQYNSGSPFLKYASLCWINHLQVTAWSPASTATLDVPLRYTPLSTLIPLLLTLLIPPPLPTVEPVPAPLPLIP